MKIYRIYIWMVAFGLAYFLGKGIIRNLWRFYYSPFKKTLIKNEQWNIEDLKIDLHPDIKASLLEGPLILDKNGFGKLAWVKFYWKYDSFEQKITLKGENQVFLDGVYRIRFLNGKVKQIVIMEKEGVYLKADSEIEIYTFDCVGARHRNYWNLNERIPWF